MRNDCKKNANSLTQAAICTVVEIPAVSKTITVNGKPITMDTEAVNICVHAHIPVRFVAETPGYTAEYGGEGVTTIKNVC